MTHSLKTYKSDRTYPEVSLDSSSYRRSYSRREKWICGLLCGAVTLSIVFGIFLTLFIVTDGKFFVRLKEGELFGSSKFFNKTKKIGEIQASKAEEDVMNMTKCLNNEVDPCEDFYEFACGNYARESYLPESELFVTPRRDAESSTRRKLIKLLESNSSSTGYTKALQVAKAYYQSCIKIEDDLTGLIDLLEDYGGWPVVKGDNWKSKTFEKLLYKNVENGISTNFIFNAFVDLDWKDSNKTKIYLDQPSFGMASRLYLLEDFNEAKLTAYLNFQARMAKLLGADDEAEATKELENSLLFEIALAQVSQNADERRNKSKLYNPMSLKHLQNMTKNTSWKEYLEGVLDMKKLSDEEEIIVMSPKYLEDVGKILKKSKKRDVANYVMWRTVLESTEYLFSPEIQKIKSKFFKSFYNGGASKMEERDLCCERLFSKNFPLLSSSLLWASFGEGKNSKIKLAEEIVDYVKMALKESTKEVSWIRKNVTLERMKKKWNSIEYFFTGVRDKIFDPEFLNYEKLLLDSSDSFFDNQRKLFKLKMNKISRLQNGDWEDPSRVLAERNSDPFHIVYRPEENIVYFPISILDKLEFGLTQSKFSSFVKLGTSAGFGLSQAMDDIGRQYTEKGVLKIWWDKGFSLEYKEIMECIAKQYRHLLDQEKISIPTRKSRAKNWSDLSGISVAYKAYQNWKKDNNMDTVEEFLFSTLNYTTNQFFWISYAQSFCTNARNFTQYANSMLMESDSVPGKIRVNGPLQNLETFSRDWECPLDSQMNPNRKCLIW